MKTTAVVLALCVGLVAAHDWARNERNTGDDPSSLNWNPNQPPCSYIVRPPYSAFRSRVVGEVEAADCDDVDNPGIPDRRRMTVNDVDAQTRFADAAGMGVVRQFGEGDNYNQGAPWDDLDGTCFNSFVYMPMFGEHSDTGSSSTKATACTGTEEARRQYYRIQIGNPGEQDSQTNLPNSFAAMGDLCPGEGEPTGYFPLANVAGGSRVTRAAWHFANQGDYYFYSCTDITVINDTERLRNGADLGQLILRNAYWLVPVALLPVVAASVYSRRHKAESLRLAAMNDMNNRSIYTAKGGDRSITMLSGATAATAKTYASGYTDNASMGTGMTSRMSGSTGMTSMSGSTGMTSMSGYSDSTGYSSRH